VNRAVVAEGPCPARSESDRRGLALSHYDTAHIGECSGNTASLGFVLVNDCVKRVRQIHRVSMSFRSALSVKEVNENMVSLVDGNRIRHPSIVGDIEHCLIERQGSVKQVEGPRRGGIIMYHISHAETDRCTANYCYNRTIPPASLSLLFSLAM